MNQTIYNINADLLLYFSDIHIGLRGDNTGRLEICKKTVDNIIKIIERLGIKHIIFGGDLFHSRTSLNVNTMNVAIELVEKLAKYAEVFLLVGNHDIHYKNSRDVHSIKIFNNTANVHVISEPSEICINNSHRMLLVPWCSDLSKYNESEFDSMFGHFEFSSKYLIASYIEEQSTEYDNENIISDLIKHDIDQYLSDPSQLYSENVGDILINRNKTKSSNYIGSFINKCKPGGYVFSGHIHGRKEFLVKDRNFIFIGSPFEQNFGDINKTFGFYIHDIKNNKIKFIENKGIPKHKEVKVSEIDEGYDFSVCTGNYIKPIVDTSISYEILSSIINNINFAKPVEVFPPEYKVVIENNNIKIGDGDNEAGSNLQKNKQTYIIDYISTLSNEELEKEKLNREKLYKSVSNYFSIASKKLELVDNSNDNV